MLFDWKGIFKIAKKKFIYWKNWICRVLLFPYIPWLLYRQDHHLHKNRDKIRWLAFPRILPLFCECLQIEFEYSNAKYFIVFQNAILFWGLDREKIEKRLQILQFAYCHFLRFVSLILKSCQPWNLHIFSGDFLNTY